MIDDLADWQSASTYDYADGLASTDLAWEWLRRNEEYQRDYARIEAAESQTEMQRLTERARRRWGLHFPRLSQPEST